MIGSPGGRSRASLGDGHQAERRGAGQHEDISDPGRDVGAILQDGQDERAAHHRGKLSLEAGAGVGVRKVRSRGGGGGGRW